MKKKGKTSRDVICTKCGTTDSTTECLCTKKCKFCGSNNLEVIK